MASALAKTPLSRLRSASRSFAENALTADLRSLALFRICLGVVVLIDLVDRLVDLSMNYSDFGILPRDVMVKYADLSRFIGIHMMNGSAGFQYVLFAIQIALALAFIVGFRARLSALLSWVLMLSLESRNIRVGYSVDVVIRLALLWATFLPTGARFSIDRLLSSGPQASKDNARESNLYRAPAVFGLSLLLISIYAFSSIFKAKHAVWIDGLGTYYALSIDEYVMPVGRWMLGQPRLLRIADYSTLVLEAIGWLPLLIPCRKQWVRLPLFLVFASFHFGLGLCLNVTLFQCASIACWTSILPEYFWDHIKLAERLSSLRTRLTDQTASFLRRLHLEGDPPISEPARPLLVHALSWAIIGICLFWNIRGVLPTYLPRIEVVDRVALGFGLDQGWEMFASPANISGWFIAPGILADGTMVDLMRGGAAVDWKKPANIYRMFRDERTRKMLVGLIDDNADPLRMAYAGYLCRAWNSVNNDENKRLDAFSFIFMRQSILPTGGKEPPVPMVLGQQECVPGMMKKWGPILDLATRRSADDQAAALTHGI